MCVCDFESIETNRVAWECRSAIIVEVCASLFARHARARVHVRVLDSVAVRALGMRAYTYAWYCRAHFQYMALLALLAIHDIQIDLD